MKDIESLGFTPVESDVLKMLLRGSTRKEIAASLRVPPRDVEIAVRGLYRKFQVKTRTQFMATWIPDFGQAAPADRPRRVRSNVRRQARRATPRSSR